MATRFGNLDTQFLDNAGDPLSFGKVAFYETGSTTPKVTYRDPSLNTPNELEVALTATGTLLYDVWFDGTARAELIDQDDVQVREIDPIGVSTTTGAFDPWDNVTTYAINDIVEGSDGAFYISITNGNQGNDPAAGNPTQWTQFYLLRVWNTNETYSNTQPVLRNGLAYTSTINNNTGNDPAADAVNWQPIVASPAGAQKDFVATGAIANGDIVVLRSDGTVEVVAGVTSGFDSEVVFESATTDEISIAYDSNSKRIVIVYSDTGNSGFGTAIVGEVSGSSISFGTPVVFESASTDFISAAFDSNENKIVIAYRDVGNSNFGTAIVGDVSGTTISFGTAVVFETANVIFTAIAFDSLNNKVVIVYPDVGNSSHGTAIVGTVSGTGISFGTAVVFNSTSTSTPCIAFDSTNNKFLVAYKDNTAIQGQSRVGTVSGTSISFGSEVVFEAADVLLRHKAVTYDVTNNRIVVAYRDSGNADFGTAIVGEISGTSITYGTAVVFASVAVNFAGADYDSINGVIGISYQDGASSNQGSGIAGTVSGSTISFDTSVAFNAGNNTQDIVPVFDSNAGKAVVAYKDVGNSNFGTAIPWQIVDSSNARADNIMGIAAAAIADTETGTIIIDGGVATNQTGLNTGTIYFTDDDGNLVTTDNGKKVGRALSATELQIKTNF